MIKTSFHSSTFIYSIVLAMYYLTNTLHSAYCIRPCLPPNCYFHGNTNVRPFSRLILYKKHLNRQEGGREEEQDGRKSKMEERRWEGKAD